MLLFTKGGTTENIWFYDMEHDGFSLDDKRQRVAENDIPDVLDCWKHRRDAKFQQSARNASPTCKNKSPRSKRRRSSCTQRSTASPSKPPSLLTM